MQLAAFNGRLWDKAGPQGPAFFVSPERGEVETELSTALVVDSASMKKNFLASESGQAVGKISQTLFQDLHEPVRW